MMVDDPKMLPAGTEGGVNGGPPQGAGKTGGGGHGDGARGAALLPPPHTKGHPAVSAIVWVVALAVFAAIGYFGWRYYESSKTAADKKTERPAKPLPVVVERSRLGNMDIYIDRIGSVSAFNTVTLRTRVDGQLDKVLFKEGQMVNAGELLFQIDPRPYQVQLEQAEGQLAKDQATLNNAKVDLTRYQLAEEAISKQQLTTAEAAVGTAEGTVKADQGAIDAAKLNITYCKILAPISGRIGLRAVDEGNMVHESDTGGLAVITQLQPIAVLFSPPQDDLPRVQKAMAKNAEVRVEAWDRNDENQIATGKVLALQNEIDPSTGTFQVKAVFANTDNALYPNQFVNVRLLVDSMHNVILVPDASIQQSPTSAFVYVVGADKKVEMNEVTVGPSEKGYTVVEGKGIGPDLEVVTAGVDKLEPKMVVDPHESEEPATQAGTQAASQRSAVTQSATQGSSPAKGSTPRKSGGRKRS